MNEDEADWRLELFSPKVRERTREAWEGFCPSPKLSKEEAKEFEEEEFPELSEYLEPVDLKQWMRIKEWGWLMSLMDDHYLRY